MGAQQMKPRQNPSLTVGGLGKGALLLGAPGKGGRTFRPSRSLPSPIPPRHTHSP